jgi:cyclohexanecarboxylate-CoA ligase
MFETTLTAALADARREEGTWPGTLVGEVLRRTAATEPHRTAVVDARGRYSYGDLAALVDDLAIGLLELGVRRGDVVSVQLPNWYEFIGAAFALERIGAVINPIAPIFRQHELRTMFRLARPVVVIVPADFRGFDYPSMLVGLAGDSPSVRCVVVVDGSPGQGDLSWKELVDRGRASSIDRRVLDILTPAPDDVYEIIFTSGTTGEPKGVMHTHNTLWAANRAMIDVQSYTAADVFHMASTFAHQTGLLFGARLFAQTGASGVFQDVWDATAFLDLVERERITSSAGAAPFLADVLRVDGLENRDLSSWRVFGCFGAPIPLPLLEEAKRRLPCRVMPGWGMSEVGLVTSTSPGDPDEKAMTTDGRALPSMAVRVVDERGNDVAPGQEGDLLCKGCGEFVGYVQGRAFTEACYAAGGWFMTGDRARIDGDGFIRITGRTKDLIIRGGENVPVKEVEDVLIRHPKVRAVAIVGAPHERLGEIGCAFVVAEGEAPTMAELRDHFDRAGVTRQFWPEQLRVLEEMPMTPSGKIQKFKLRELAQQQPD